MNNTQITKEITKEEFKELKDKINNYIAFHLDQNIIKYKVSSLFNEVKNKNKNAKVILLDIFFANLVSYKNIINKITLYHDEFFKEIVGLKNNTRGNRWYYMNNYSDQDFQKVEQMKKFYDKIKNSFSQDMIKITNDVKKIEKIINQLI